VTAGGMAYRFFTCDVFTRNRFGGNPLAVLPDATGLTARQMQQIAREFNYSETTFVLPPESGQTNRIRIFTPTREVAFAGHPNIGTAFVLATIGRLGDFADQAKVVFEEGAGRVPVRISRRPNGEFRCELTAPQGLSLGPEVDVAAAASALTLDPDDVDVLTHPPIVASVGLPFLIVRVSGQKALARARINMDGIEALHASGMPADVLFYTDGDGDAELRARMFAPLDGVPEDPATGSANCALAALLAHADSADSGDFGWHILQGVEMGRPSVLETAVRKHSGVIREVRVGGDCVMVCEGTIRLD
jgi:trans-2,3-dihydro-3-hydroxyanthranilate isomerase